MSSTRKLFEEGVKSGSRIDDPSIAKVVLVVISGNSTNPELTKEERVKLVKAVPGVKIVAVGTTSNVSKEHLNIITGNPRNSIIYDSINAFEKEKTEIYVAICKTQQKLQNKVNFQTIAPKVLIDLDL